MKKVLLPRTPVVFQAFFSSADFLKELLFQKILSGTQAECQMAWIQINTDQHQHPNLGPNSLLRLSADDKSCR